MLKFFYNKQAVHLNGPLFVMYVLILSLVSFFTAQFTLPFAFTLLAVVLVKPFISSVTLGAGGDGGVFAPSIVIGALLGLLVALVFNHYLHADLRTVNFVVIGIAAVLSASIHAPLTATALGCCFTGGYVIALPVLIACVVSKYVARTLFKDTVYTYISH